MGSLELAMAIFVGSWNRLPESEGKAKKKKKTEQEIQREISHDIVKALGYSDQAASSQGVSLAFLCLWVD